MAKKWVYLFTEVKEAEKYVGGSWDAVRGFLGGKGANLFEMTRIGLPVPPGFTVTTEACNAYLAAGEKFPEGMWDQALMALKEIERITGKGFGEDAGYLCLDRETDTVVRGKATKTKLVGETFNATSNVRSTFTCRPDRGCDVPPVVDPDLPGELGFLKLPEGREVRYSVRGARGDVGYIGGCQGYTSEAPSFIFEVDGAVAQTVAGFVVSSWSRTPGEFSSWARPAPQCAPLVGVNRRNVRRSSAAGGRPVVLTNAPEARVGGDFGAGLKRVIMRTHDDSIRRRLVATLTALVGAAASPRSCRAPRLRRRLSPAGAAARGRGAPSSRTASPSYCLERTHVFGDEASRASSAPRRRGSAVDLHLPGRRLGPGRFGEDAAYLCLDRATDTVIRGKASKAKLAGETFNASANVRSSFVCEPDPACDVPTVVDAELPPEHGQLSLFSGPQARFPFVGAGGDASIAHIAGCDGYVSEARLRGRRRHRASADRVGPTTSNARPTWRACSSSLRRAQRAARTPTTLPTSPSSADASVSGS
jgi:hypothetical protein